LEAIDELLDYSTLGACRHHRISERPFKIWVTLYQVYKAREIVPGRFRV
jgi:hypothetical protein